MDSIKSFIRQVCDTSQVEVGVKYLKTLNTKRWKAVGGMIGMQYKENALT
jgi:hypothetical protein